MPASIQSPVLGLTDSTWLKTSNMVGINVRTIGTFCFHRHLYQFFVCPVHGVAGLECHYLLPAVLLD